MLMLSVTVTFRLPLEACNDSWQLAKVASHFIQERWRDRTLLRLLQAAEACPPPSKSMFAFSFCIVEMRRLYKILNVTAVVWFFFPLLFILYISRQPIPFAWRAPAELHAFWKEKCSFSPFTLVSRGLHFHRMVSKDYWPIIHRKYHNWTLKKKGTFQECTVC